MPDHPDGVNKFSSIIAYEASNTYLQPTRTVFSNPQIMPQTLSHYRIVEELGRGGMGIVYKAEDTKLDRTVALKLLPPHALISEDDRARFYREARAAAALNHPNIAHVYEIDEAETDGESRPFIAMEYIDGVSLSDLVAKGPLPLKDAISYASQIAEGLKVAHEAHVVHRDIKSGNIMLTKKGVVKILDFGLAKTAASTKLTQMGSTLGTVAYMSPEQAKGEEVDRRSDIFSLGVILYEMITGRLPFKGDYEQAVVYGILNEDPESLTTLRAGVPMALDGVMAKMLAKDPDLRYQHVDELPADLKAIDLGSAIHSSRIATSRTSIDIDDIASGEQRSHRPSGALSGGYGAALKKLWPAFLVLAVIAFAMGLLVRPASKENLPLRKVLLSFPEMQSIAFPAISSEGKWLAFAGTDSTGRGGIFLYEMATANLLRVPESEQFSNGIFSPDGRQLLLASNNNTGAATMVVPNGVPNKVVGSGNWHVWETSNSILYTQLTSSESSIYRLTLDGSEPEFVAAADSTLDWATQPYVDGRLPGGLLIGGIQAPNGSRHVMALLDPETRQWSVGEEGVANPSYIGSGYVIYQVGNDFGKLVVRHLDGKAGVFTGSPREVLPLMRWGEYSVGGDGSLVFVPQLASEDESSRLFLISGDPPSLVSLNLSTNDEIIRPSFSPSGDEVAFEVLPANGGERFIAVYDVERSVMSQRTFSGVRRYPRWSSDGAWLYYHDEERRVHRRRADGSGEEETVIESAVMPDLSADGRWLVVSRFAEGESTDLLAMDLETGASAVLDSSDGSQLQASISPSSRYVAFRTFASGEERIAVRPMEGTAYWIVSDMNANRPRWSSDERFIYFLSPGLGIYRIEVSTSNGFRTVGEPERVATAYGDAFFDVDPSGTTLVVTGTGVSLQEGEGAGATLGWWQNWVQSLPETDGL
jgi:serine/threonine protein kinase